MRVSFERKRLLARLVPPTLMRQVINISFFLAFSLIVNGRCTEAEQASASPAKPSPTAPPPTPIPLAEIASQAQSALESVHNIEDNLAGDRTAATVAKRLPQVKQEIDSETAENAKLVTISLPLDLLDRVALGWHAYNGTLSAWNHDLTGRAKTLDDQIARLDQMSKIWQSTLQSPEISQTSLEIRKPMQNLIDSIGQTRQAVESRRAELLTLQSRVLELTASVETASASVEEAEAKAVKSLFVPDSPPIWSKETGGWIQGSRESFFAQVSAFTAYFSRRPAILLIHLIIIVLLALVVHWLRRGVHKWTEEEPNLRRAAPVFDLPISTAIALSFLVTAPLYALAPRLFRAILGTALLIPVILILRRLIDRTLFPILNALVVFYFVDQLRLIAAAMPLLSRFMFSVEMAGAIVFLIWLIRGKHLPMPDADTTKRFAGTLRVITRICLILFAATLLANVFGYVNLANLVGNGVLRSAYAALALYTALRIVEGLIIIALEIRPLALLGVVRLHRPMLQRRLQGLAEFLAFLCWLSLTLSFFSLETPLVQGIAAALSASFGVGSIRISIGRIVAFVIAVWASFLISRFVRFLLEEDIYQHFQLTRGLSYAISTMLHYLILLVGFFVALGALGVDLTKFTIVAGAFSVGIGFGLQNVINNFVSGLILLFERPIKVGDVIEVGGAAGEVQRIGIRASIIRTSEGSEVIVPNGALISGQVTNWTFSNRQRAVEVPVSVAPGQEPQRVVELLKKVALGHPKVAKQPAPQAYVVNFSSGGATYQLRAWTDRYEDWVQVRSDLAVAVNDALARENIAIA